MSRNRQRLTFANVISVIALFVALGGGAYAVSVAKKNSVVSKSIKNGQVKTKDLGKNTVNSAKVANNSLSGADINESSLGAVPLAAHANSADSATSAQNASQLGGLAPSAYQSRVSGSCPSSAIASIGADGSASCAHGSVEPVRFSSIAGGTTSRSDIGVLGLQNVCRNPTPSDTKIVFTNDGSSSATLNWVYADVTPTLHASGTSVGPNSSVPFDFSGGGRIEGQFIFSYIDSAGNGQETTVSLHAVDLGSFCEVAGTAQTATFHD